MKAQVKNIMIKRGEGKATAAGFKPYNFPTFEAAQDHLRSIGYTAPKPGNGYDKVDFVISWEGDEDDKNSYSGRFDMQYGGLDSGETLREHVKNFLLFMAGEKKPGHMTDAQYKNYLLTSGSDKAEAREYLDTHEI